MEEMEQLNQINSILPKAQGDTQFQAVAGFEWSGIISKCQTAASKVELKDATFQTLEGKIQAENHIIVCGLVESMVHFMMPLRAKYLDQLMPIVILHDEPPSDKQWNQICLFSEIYFVKGTAMKKKDLVRANIDKAIRVVIFAPSVEELSITKYKNSSQEEEQEEDDDKTKTLDKDEENLLDAKTIFKYKTISKLRPDLNIVTELISPSNLSFLLPRPKDYLLMKTYKHQQTPTFASGDVYLSSVLDSLICQTTYNPSLLTVLNQLILEQQENDLNQSNLFHLQVPKAFVNKPFEMLFEYLTTIQKIIPLGIYRPPLCLDNKQPFVVTNPLPSALLTGKDQIFVLALEKPNPKLSEFWGSPKAQDEEISSQDQGENENIQQINPFQNQGLDGDTNLPSVKDRENPHMTQQIQQKRNLAQQEITSKIEKVKNLLTSLKQEIVQREQVIYDKAEYAFQQELQSIMGQKNQMSDSSQQGDKLDEKSEEESSGSNSSEK